MSTATRPLNSIALAPSSSAREFAGRINVASLRRTDYSPLMPELSVSIAVIVQARQILIAQRAAGGSFGLFWEFPGGKCEPGEPVEVCLHREIKEEIDCDIQIIRPLEIIRHNYPNGRLAIHPFLCRLAAGAPRAMECEQILWINPPELANYKFPPANESLLHYLMKLGDGVE